MKKSYIIAPLLAFSSLSQAEETPKAETTATDSAEAINLFNGKDLTGWKIRGGNGQYKVEDGAIVGYGNNINANTFLCTEKEYGDFEVTFEFKFDHLQGNSGFMFRAVLTPGKGIVSGYQCEGDNTKRAWTAGLYDESRRGWLFPHQTDPKHAQHRDDFTAEGNSIFKWNDWNTIKIRCKGNHIQTWLNGVKRVDFVDTDATHDTRSGFFGLQVHNGKEFSARWRNIQLKELK